LRKRYLVAMPVALVIAAVAMAIVHFGVSHNTVAVTAMLVGPAAAAVAIVGAFGVLSPIPDQVANSQD